MHLSSSQTKIYVAGHHGMVGRAIWYHLQDAGYTKLIGRSSDELALRDPYAMRQLFEEKQPDFVVLAAARVGGILANDRYPADFIADNLAIEQSVIQAAHETGVDRLIFLESTCIYPKHAPQPIPEDSLLTGPLEPTNQWYVVAKIAGRKLCEAMHRQYGDDMLTLMPINLCGPGDDFDLEAAHVLPALLRKVHEAKRGGTRRIGRTGDALGLRHAEAEVSVRRRPCSRRQICIGNPGGQDPKDCSGRHIERECGR